MASETKFTDCLGGCYSSLGPSHGIVERSQVLYINTYTWVIQWDCSSDTKAGK